VHSAPHHLPTRRSSDLPCLGETQRIGEEELNRIGIVIAHPDHDLDRIEWFDALSEEMRIRVPVAEGDIAAGQDVAEPVDRQVFRSEETRLNSSHVKISY